MASKPRFEIAIVFQRLTNLRNLVGSQAHLAGFSTRIAHRKYPERMALAAGTFQAPRGVTDGALEKGAAKDPCWGRELGRKFIAFADGLVSCHR